MPSVIDLTSFSGLCDAVAQWLNRTDLTNQIPSFIVLAESKMARRIRRKTITNTIAVIQAETGLPTDCAELRSVRPVTASQSQDLPFTLSTVEVLAEHRAARADAVGRPVWGAVLGNKLLLCPSPDQAYNLELRYFEKLIPLSATNTSNSILAEAPDAYLFGALVAAEGFVENDERIAGWQAQFEDVCEELDDVRNREESMASIRTQRLPVVFGQRP